MSIQPNCQKKVWEVLSLSGRRGDICQTMVSAILRPWVALVSEMLCNGPSNDSDRWYFQVTVAKLEYHHRNMWWPQRFLRIWQLWQGVMRWFYGHVVLRCGPGFGLDRILPSWGRPRAPDDLKPLVQLSMIWEVGTFAGMRLPTEEIRVMKTRQWQMIELSHHKAVQSLTTWKVGGSMQIESYLGGYRWSFSMLYWG